MNKKLTNVKKKLKITSVTLTLVMGLSAATPEVTVFASELKQESQTSLWDIEKKQILIMTRKKFRQLFK
jgi:hypothetical protein